LDWAEAVKNCEMAGMLLALSGTDPLYNTFIHRYHTGSLKGVFVLIMVCMRCLKVLECRQSYNMQPGDVFWAWSCWLGKLATRNIVYAPPIAWLHLQ